MASFFRTAFAAAVGALILLPLWATNGAVDRLFRGGAPPHATLDLQPVLAGHLNGEVMARLQALRAEIRADLCSRGKQKYCALNYCLSIPSDCSGKCTTAQCRQDAP